MLVRIPEYACGGSTMSGETSIKVLVDSRGQGESEVFELLSAPGFTTVPVERACLDVGDYAIVDGSGRTVVLVERKSHQDMAGSLRTNNHLKEQICRLKAFQSQNPEAVTFILYEGCMGKTWYQSTNGGIPNSSIDMMLTCICSREGLGLHHTVSLEHTAAWISSLARKEAKGQLRAPSGTRGAVSEAGYIRTLAMSKTANTRATSPWTRVLMSVDGMSAVRAIAVVHAFPTCASLAKRLRDDGGVEAVANIQVKRQRLGPAIAKRLHKLFT
jgi:ERCC4-type nuclease